MILVVWVVARMLPALCGVAGVDRGKAVVVAWLFLIRRRGWGCLGYFFSF